ncbi:MAG: hypothetical protein B9S32_07045 [Verrucomicrobia bacterium Tous-C9LFEB]|nr:MAG: hypothetical protein B9S32_07045 [Verrucomicrobia bacterium Tous-C9LFEB]
MATILQFPPPQRYAHRRNVSAIPGYRVEAQVEEHPLAPRRLLSQLWVAVLTLALIFLAIDLASADPLKYGSTNSTSVPTTTSSAPFSVATPGGATLPASANTTTADDIRDIRGVVHIAPSWMWLVYLLGGLALAAALYALYRWWKSRAKERAKTSFELALEALDQARSLMAPDKVREYSFRVSEITRNYIEARFGTRAAHRTTEEFLHDLVDKPSTRLAEHAPLLEEFLKHCDLAKFARWTLSPEEMEKMHTSAVAFVTATNPALEANSPTAPELRSSEA